MTPKAALPREHAACPGCGGNDSEVAHLGRLTLGEELVDQETRVCRTCGLVFEQALPERDWNAFYGTVWQRGIHASDHHRALYAADAERLGEGRGRLAYEIGCGCGFLLDELRARGWRTAGCDPERLAAAEACAKGHAVEPELFRARPGFQADLVVLGDVLEHQSDPRSLLAELRRIVAPAGRFYVRVPDLEAIDFESFGDVFGLQHRVWFTRETLVEFLASSGFEVLLHGSHGRGQHALTRPARPRPARRPACEPRRSLELVRRYSQALAEQRARIDERLASLDGRRVALYGGGEHARELLSFSRLSRLARRVVDGNPNLWGRRCGGIPIESPKALRERPPQAIVIASRAYQDQIAAELADLEARGVELVRLYEGVPA